VFSFSRLPDIVAINIIDLKRGLGPLNHWDLGFTSCSGVGLYVRVFFCVCYILLISKTSNGYVLIFCLQGTTISAI
jgi:hypothetical protein